MENTRDDYMVGKVGDVGFEHFEDKDMPDAGFEDVEEEVKVKPIKEKKPQKMRVGTQQDSNLTTGINAVLTAGPASGQGNLSEMLDSLNSKRNVVESKTVRVDFDTELTDEEKEDAVLFAKQQRLHATTKKYNSLVAKGEKRLKAGADGNVSSAFALMFLTDLWFALMTIMIGYYGAQFCRFIMKKNGDARWFTLGGVRKKFFSAYTSSRYTSIV